MQATLHMGREPYQQMFIATTAAFAYITSSLIAGKWVTPKTAPWLMIAATILTAALGATAMLVNEFYAFFFIAFGMGACTGHYYVPFQINMSHVKPFNTLAWSLAFYNLAWGIGASIGPFTGTWFRQAHWGVLVSMAGAVVIIHTALNLLAMTAPRSIEVHTTKAAFTSTFHQRLAGWLSYAISGFLMRGLSSVLIPKIAGQLQWTDKQSAWAVMLVFLPIPIGALLWAKLRFRLEQTYILSGLMILGAISFLIIPMTSHYYVIIACIFGVGLATSCAVFHSLYYALASPAEVRSKSISIAEAVAGMGSLGGPILAGLISWDDALAPRTYITGFLLMLSMVVINTWCGKQHVKTVSPAISINQP